MCIKSVVGKSGNHRTFIYKTVSVFFGIPTDKIIVFTHRRRQIAVGRAIFHALTACCARTAVRVKGNIYAACVRPLGIKLHCFSIEDPDSGITIAEEIPVGIGDAATVCLCIPSGKDLARGSGRRVCNQVSVAVCSIRHFHRCVWIILVYPIAIVKSAVVYAAAAAIGVILHKA